MGLGGLGVGLSQFVGGLKVLPVDGQLIAGCGHHQDTGVDGGQVVGSFLGRTEMSAVVGVAYFVGLVLFDFVGEVGPGRLGADSTFFMLKYFFLVVRCQIVGEVASKLIEQGNIGSHSGYVVTLLTHVNALLPALGLHCDLDHLKGRPNIRHVFHKSFQLVNITAVPVEHLEDL